MDSNRLDEPYGTNKTCHRALPWMLDKRLHDQKRPLPRTLCGQFAGRFLFLGPCVGRNCRKLSLLRTLFGESVWERSIGCPNELILPESKAPPDSFGTPLQTLLRIPW